MAREPSETDNGESMGSGKGSSVGDRSNGTLRRRSYLKLAGAVAGIATTALAGTAAASDDYEVIEIPAGRHETIFVRSGETFENKIIDVSAPGAQCSINARHETNWTIRNIGFRGQADGGAFFGVSETSPNGTSTMENIYIGDGTDPGNRSGLGIFVGGEHRGTVEIKRTYIEGMGDNSFYCSPPGRHGEVHFENCYSKNSWVAHYRLARGSIKNCVAVNDGRPRSHDQPNHDGRGVWLWNPGPVEVEDCDFAMGGRHYSFVSSAGRGGGTIYVRNTQWDDTFHGGIRSSEGRVAFRSGNGNSPVDRVPEGCPTSPEEAASGGGSSGGSGSSSGGSDDNSLEHTMTFEGGPGEYYWQVHDGPIQPIDGGEKMWVSENGRYAAGVLEAGEEHRWEYDSFLADIEIDEGVEATINGAHTPTWDLYPDERADSRDWYEDVPWYDDDAHDPLEHTMTFEGGPGEYYWQVHDGPIQPIDGGEKMWVSENGRYAAGVLEAGEKHRWEYDSFLADIEIDEGVEATINGAHTPTWDLYPDERADSRDWYEDVPW